MNRAQFLRLHPALGKELGQKSDVIARSDERCLGVDVVDQSPRFERGQALVVSQSFRFCGGPEYVSIVSELMKGS